jgi:hypothetical protein
MFNTISNLSRKSDKYGDVHFISFLGANLARLAYDDDKKFLKSYLRIMGPVVYDQLLAGIDSVDHNNLRELLDDEKIFGLHKKNNPIQAGGLNVNLWGPRKVDSVASKNPVPMVNTTDKTGLNKPPQMVPSGVLTQMSPPQKTAQHPLVPPTVSIPEATIIPNAKKIPLMTPVINFDGYTYDYNGKKYIDFIALGMPQNINILNGEIKGKAEYPIPGKPASPGSVKYISIGWSNYGEVYVVADKRMPQTLLLLFRGTYSAKTAALYSKATSLVPLTVCKDKNGNPESFLYGIFKPSLEMIHTIVEAMRYLATTFLNATKEKPVKIFTTGHSLGGAMCSNFAYLWMGVKKTAPYNGAEYNMLTDNIICISLGAPRCMSSSVAQKFCKFVEEGKILFLRITTRGDPVPGLPPKTGFQHPCSENSEMRKVVSEDCNAQLTMRPTPNVNYKGDLDCQNYKTRAYAPNPLSHTIYLDILYVSGVDIPKFFKGIGIAQEVSRTSTGSTVCRLIMGENVVNPQTKDYNYQVVFFDVNKAREKPTNVDVIQEKELNAVGQQGGRRRLAGGFGGPVAEDRRVTFTAFNALIRGMKPLSPSDLCPQKGDIVDPFTGNNDIMPDLSCPGAVTGGRKKKIYSHKKRHPRHATRKRDGSRKRATRRAARH